MVFHIWNFFLIYWNFLPYPRRKVTVIVELCAGFSHTVKPYFCQHSSTLELIGAVVLGIQSVCDRRLIGRAVIFITEKTRSS